MCFATCSDARGVLVLAHCERPKGSKPGKRAAMLPMPQDLGNHYAALEGDVLNSLRGAITYERLRAGLGA